MKTTFENPRYPFKHHSDLNQDTAVHHPVVIVGAGPTGLAMGVDLAMQGISTVILDDNNTVSVGSRAICFAKRTLEILNRYRCVSPMLDKGVTWKKGKVFFQQDLVYEFDLLPEEKHKLPAFINLQQYYLEQYLVEFIDSLELVDLRWLNRVTEVEQRAENNRLEVETPEGNYVLTCDYLLVADGANSPIRKQLGLESRGQVFKDRFLIADVLMKAGFPSERWFWFDPPFHPNQSALLHRQADDVWRIDLQLGWDADPQVEVLESNIRPRLEAMLGADVDFQLEWASVYTFQCRKLDSFLHDRVIFVGDAAHQASPFGARGANGAIQSVDNLGWKLASVLKQQGSTTLLKTYDIERQMAADENILNSSRATDFITPKNKISRVFRDATLQLAKDYEFARTLVNSGRLSTPARYLDSPLNTLDDEKSFDGGVAPGSAALDAPIIIGDKTSWLIDILGTRFTLLIAIDKTDISRVGESLPELLQSVGIDLMPIFLFSESTDLEVPKGAMCICDPWGYVAQRYQLEPGTCYLFRPDQVVAGRWREFTSDRLISAVNRALGFDMEVML